MVQQYGEALIDFSTATVLPTGETEAVLGGDVAAAALTAIQANGNASNATVMVNGATQLLSTVGTNASAALDASNENTAGLNVVTTKTITKVSPRLRGPNQGDDYTNGYTPLNIAAAPEVFADRWNLGNDAWTCEQNLPGFGAWVKNVGALGYPGSSIVTTGAWLFVGGTLRMVAGYTGPAINVINPVSGANKDIGLLADDTLDEKTLWSFMGSSGYLNVATVYDQTGNAHHITQATAANQYKIVQGMRVGRAVALINDSDTFDTAAPITRFMTVPAGVTVAAGGSISGVSIGNTRGFNIGSTALALTGSDGKSYGTAIASDFVTGDGGNNAPPSIASAGLFPINGFVMGFGCAPTTGGASSNIYANGKMAFAGNAGGAGWTGGFLGIQAANDQAGPHEIVGIMIYDAILQLTADPQAIIANLEHHFALTPQVKDMLILDGDSITYGYLVAYNQDYPHQIRPLLSHDFQVYNTGFPGNTTTQRVAALPGILKYTNASQNPNVSQTQNVLVEWSGTNDIGLGGTTLATMQSNMTQMVELGKAAGCKVVVCTTLPQSSFTAGSAQETLRESWNTWLRSGASGADAVADVAADPTMGNYANTTGGVFYNPDGTHPTALGVSYIVPIIAKAINSVVP